MQHATRRLLENRVAMNLPCWFHWQMLAWAVKFNWYHKPRTMGQPRSQGLAFFLGTRLTMGFFSGTGCENGSMFSATYRYGIISYILAPAGLSPLRCKWSVEAPRPRLHSTRQNRSIQTPCSPEKKSSLGPSPGHPVRPGRPVRKWPDPLGCFPCMQDSRLRRRWCRQGRLMFEPSEHVFPPWVLLFLGTRLHPRVHLFVTESDGRTCVFPGYFFGCCRHFLPSRDICGFAFKET